MDELKINTLKRFKMGKLSIPTMEGYLLINIADVLYLEAENAYTKIYLDGGTSTLSTKNIGFYENELKEEAFLRVHNSYIVNLAKIAKYVKADDGYLLLQNKKVIRVSRNRKEDLLFFFKSLRC